MVLCLGQLVQIAAAVFLFADAASVKNPRTITTGRLCQRDVLLILDTSRSVAKHPFETQIKPFLEALFTDKELNVRHNGTQVSLMVFSDYSDPSSSEYKRRLDHTKILINFSDGYDGQALKNYVKKLTWEDVKGGHTRTDKALEIANTKVFPFENPLNNRISANDIIILITDGKPHGVYNAPKIAIENAKKLKDKGIKIIGIGVGRKIKHRRFWTILQSIASPNEAIRSNFENLQSVRKWLERKSCEIAASSCSCADTRSAPYYLKPNETSIAVSLGPPILSCRGNYQAERTSIKLNPTSPQYFNIGQHEVRYKYSLKNGQAVECVVRFEVKDCSCPPTNLKSVQVKPGEGTVRVQWTIPRPNCFKDQMVAVENKFLSIGSHSIEYKYKIDKNHNMTCNVHVEVKGSLCSDTPYNNDSQVCCWGTIHDKKSNFKCCGQYYYDTTKKKCCPGLNTREKGESCPVSS